MRLLRRAAEVLVQQGPRMVVIKAAWTARNHYLALKEKRLAPAVRRRLQNDPPRTIDAVLDFLWSPDADLIRPEQVRGELEALLRLVFGGDAPRTIMEIGTHNGGTLCAFAALAADDATIISLDLPGGAFGGGYMPWKIPLYQSFAKPGQTMHLIRDDSHSPLTLERIRGILGGRRLDFLLIDGDHTYDGVKLDHEMYAPLVRPGGVIAFHDIARDLPQIGNAVGRYWQTVKAATPHQEFRVKDPVLGDVGIGVIRG